MKKLDLDHVAFEVGKRMGEQLNVITAMQSSQMRQIEQLRHSHSLDFDSEFYRSECEEVELFSTPMLEVEIRHELSFPVSRQGRVCALRRAQIMHYREKVISWSAWVKQQA